jgi:three-Cys-motif partner protein
MNNFGGDWTKQKIDTFVAYVESYLTILNAHKRKNKWKTIYFDGFAGTGEIVKKKKKKKSSKAAISAVSIFSLIQDDLTAEQDIQKVYEGAALRVFTMPPPFRFDFYCFVEMNKKKCEILDQRLSAVEIEERGVYEVRPDDCNSQLLKLSDLLKKKQGYASLIFLDPFGMQLSWSTIEQLKGTRSDVWILVPSGVGVNRLLDCAKELKSVHVLESFFGMTKTEIEEVFYKKPEIDSTQISMFDGLGLEPIESNTEKIKDPINRIAEIYCEKMATVWEHVSKPLPLLNKNGLPIFHFVFASNNKTGLKIANYLVEKNK